MEGMRTFKADRWEHLEFVIEGRAHGFRAPGTIVLVVQEGTGWVMRQDGSRETVEEKSVVIFDTGDWLEYGTSSNRCYRPNR